MAGHYWTLELFPKNVCLKNGELANQRNCKLVNLSGFFYNKKIKMENLNCVEYLKINKGNKTLTLLPSTAMPFRNGTLTK